MAKRRIIVFEDEGISSMRIQGILGKKGYAVTSTVFSGEEAVKSEKELRKHCGRLMEIVKERTSELRKVNEELGCEIEKRKLAEAEALRSAHLASLGELVAGVAHEINNPVNGIINYARIMVNKSNGNDNIKDIAGRIIKEGDRISHIVNSLLSFARGGKEEKYPADIHGIMSVSVALIGTQLRKDGIRLRISIPTGLPEIIAKPQQIEQIFLNIISNAQHALNTKYPGAHYNKILEIVGGEATINNSRHVRMIFHDRGTGINKEILAKVINPFFSTKSGDRNTGLGLSISHGIISDHGGKLIIDSVEGEFTKVIVELPAGNQE